MPRPKPSTIVQRAFERAQQNVDEADSPSTFGSGANAEVSYASTRNVLSDRYLPRPRAETKATPMESPEIQECRAAANRLMAASKKNIFESDKKIFEYDKAEKVMDYQSQRRRSIQSQISDMATTRTAITKVDAAKRSTAYNDMLFDVCGVMLERKGTVYVVSTVRHGSVAQEDGVNNGQHFVSVDFNKDTPEYGRAEGQEIAGLTMEGICEMIAGAPDLDPGMIGFENPDDEVGVKIYGTQLRFRSQLGHIQTSVDAATMKEKIQLLRSSAKNIGIHEGLILRNCWTLFTELNENGSGQLSKEDLAKGFRQVLRIKVSEQQVAEMFTAADISETGTVSFQDFKETVIQVSSATHFLERFTPWLPIKDTLISVLHAPDRRSEMDALRPWVIFAAVLHSLAVAALLGVSLSRWKAEDKTREQWDGLEQDEVRLIRGIFLIGCLLISVGSTVASMRQSSPVFMAVSFMCCTAMSAWSVISSALNADIANADGERRGEIVLGLVMVFTGSVLAATLCMLLIRVSCFIWFREKVNAEIRARMAREIPKRTRLTLANKQ